MAVATLSPDNDADSNPGPITDPVTFTEAAALLEECGVDFHWKTLERWAKVDRLRTERRGVHRAKVVSYSDLLEAHKRRYPAPGR